MKSSGIVKSGIKKDSDETAKFELVKQNMFDCNDWGESSNIGVCIDFGFGMSTDDTTKLSCTAVSEKFVGLDETIRSEVVREGEPDWKDWGEISGIGKGIKFDAGGLTVNSMT